jgi:uncharacterized membrane protein YphA (DoxX/SURF4 family)
MRDPGGPATDAVQMLPPSATRALRIAFGILFLWLGLLKIVPGVSPAEDLMRASMPSFVPIDLFIRFAAVWEIVIGIGFLTARYRRLVVVPGVYETGWAHTGISSISQLWRCSSRGTRSKPRAVNGVPS